MSNWITLSNSWRGRTVLRFLFPEQVIQDKALRMYKELMTAAGGNLNEDFTLYITMEIIPDACNKNVGTADDHS